MPKTNLVVDLSFLCWRAHHSVGHLENRQGHPTGVLYGCLRDIRTYTERFAADRCIFACDGPNLLRKQLCPTYKIRRLDGTPEEFQLRQDVYQQIHDLRTNLLGKLGYRNILYQTGFEADDLIATACQVLQDEEVVIVSADHDLYQLLDLNVIIFNPNLKNGPQTINRKAFIEKYGIKPRQWVQVKALAGCETDNVIGVKGIGELTACNYLAGKLKAGSKKLDLCMNNTRTVAQNWPLVELPFPGTEVPKLVDDEVSEQKWRSVLKELDFHSLLAR